MSTPESTIVHLTIDRSIDCTSLQSIVAGICTPAMAAQEKAITLFEFARRVMFHFPQRSEIKIPGQTDPDLDATRLINTYGYSFCTQQSLVLVDLCLAAGLKAAVWGMPGHGTAQVEYDGGLHWFDMLIGAYVYRRESRTIASLQEVAADPTLLARAAAEGRVGPGYVPCRYVFRDDSAHFCKENPAYIRQCADAVDDVGYMAKYAANAREAWKPNPPLYDPEISLRPGESVQFLWDHLPSQSNCKFLFSGQAPQPNIAPPEMLPPHHFCGHEAEERDPVNAPYWRPYRKPINSVQTGRYHANGWHVYHATPNSAQFTWRMKTPHVYTSATIVAECGGPATASLSTDQGNTWSPIDITCALTDEIRGRRDVLFRLESSHPIRSVRTDAIFQHNMFARPHLMPGENRVSFAAEGEVPVTSELKWVEEGREESRFFKIPATWGVHVSGDEIPRMRSLTLSCSPNR